MPAGTLGELRPEALSCAAGTINDQVVSVHRRVQ
jgi:hypothetical protein